MNEKPKNQRCTYCGRKGDLVNTVDDFGNWSDDWLCSECYHYWRKRNAV